MIVLMYLAAIVAANLIVTALGPSSSVVTAFLFIGLNITARDRLHDAWNGSGLRWKMALLIGTGSMLSWAVNRNAGQIALASFVAFAAAGILDAVVYQRLIGRPWLQRVNGSNVLSSAADSFIFPTLAFGVLLPWIVLGQFLAKMCGGFLWSLIMRPRTAAVVVLLALAVPAHAQIVTVGVGEFNNDFVRQNVVELYTAAPQWVVRPNVIWAFDMHDIDRPTIVAQMGRDVITTFPVFVGVDAGATFLPFAYDDPRAHVSANLRAHLTGKLKLIVIGSWQPWNEWARGLVVKGDYTLGFWR